MNKEDLKFWIVVIVAVVLFAGDPDLVDSIAIWIRKD